MEIADHLELPGITNSKPQPVAEIAVAPTRPVSLADMPLGTLFESLKEAEGIASALRAELEPVLSAQASIRRELQKRMADENATLLAHPLAKAIIEPGAKRYDRKSDVLAELKPLVTAGLIDAADFGKFYQEEVTVKVDLRMRKRMEKYGDKVRDIINRGIVEIEGNPVFRIEWAPEAALPEGKN